MARNFYRIFTENNPVMGDSKTFGIPEAKGLRVPSSGYISYQKITNLCVLTSTQPYITPSLPTVLKEKKTDSNFE